MTRTAALAAITTCIAALVSLGTSPAVVWAHQMDGVAPSTAHIRLTVIAEDYTGYPRRTSSTAVEQDRTLDIQVDGIGTDAADQLTALSALLFADHPAIRTLQAAGLAVQGVELVRDMSERGPAGWIRRKTFTATFGFPLTLSADAGEPATAIVLGIQADSDGDGVLDVDIDPAHTETLT